MKSRKYEEKAVAVLVSVSAQVYPKETLILHHVVGDAKREGETWQLFSSVNDMSPGVRLPDGRWIIFSWQALSTAAIEAGEKEMP